MEDQHEVEFEEYEESWTGRIAIALVVALALIGGAFFAGRAMAGTDGPATLAEAVTQAQSGDLPCGDTGAAAPAGTPAAQGTPPADGGAPGAGGPGGAGGTGFMLRAICQRDGAPAAGAGQGQRGRFGGAGGGGFGQTGQVSKVSPDSLTLTGPGGETTVKLDAKTTVSKSAEGAVADIKAGDTVLVAGARGNTDAAATSITILPQTGGN
jgi:hypothetical protein